MERVSVRALVIAILVGLHAVPAAAQAPAPPGELVDRVVAIVGDSMILSSELDIELERLALMGRQLPTDPEQLAKLRREILEGKINELLLVIAAQRDSVQVPEDVVTSRVQDEIAERQRQIGGERNFQMALRAEGLTLAEYRDILAADIRRSMLIQSYLQRAQMDRRPPPVTEEELQAYFEVVKQGYGPRAASITFRQVVVAPRPSDAARDSALALASEILDRLRAGEDFAQLARRYSQDPGSRERGGDLGWFRRGQMVEQFDSAVFAMRPGQLSGIVETTFGFHIIRLDRVRGSERQARHILITAQITDADRARTREIAEEVARRIRDGESLDDLTARYHDRSERDRVGPFPRDRLPPPYDSELAQVEVGDVIGPFELAGDGGSKWAVVKVMGLTEAGEYSLDDPLVRSQVRQQLEQQKLLEELVGELRRQTYVDIRL